MKVVMTGNLPDVLMRLGLYQLVLADAAIYGHQLFLVYGSALAATGLYVQRVINFAVLYNFSE